MSPSDRPRGVRGEGTTVSGHPTPTEGQPRILDRVVTGLVGLGQRAWAVLVYSSAYLAVIAMAQVAIAMIVLDLPPSPAPVVGGLVTFAVYANDRIADADTDEATNPDQAGFARVHGERLYVIAAVAYGIAIALSVLGGPVAFAITIFPGVVWILYGSGLIEEFGVPVKRLKEVFLVNTLVVASAWAISVTVLPLAYAGAGLSLTAAVVFAYFFMGTVVTTEIPNVRDARGDQAIGVRTLPVLFGVRRTRQLLVLVNGFAIVVVSAAAFAGLLGVALTEVLIIGAGYSLAVTALLGRSDAYDLLTIAAESQYVVVSIALFAYGLWG